MYLKSIARGSSKNNEFSLKIVDDDVTSVNSSVV